MQLADIIARVGAQGQTDKLPAGLFEFLDRIKDPNEPEAIDYARGMAPEYVAERTFDALRRNRSETVLGRSARWIVRVNRLFPRLIDWATARRVRKLYAEG